MNETPYLGQSTDLVLGQEFLTWLWYNSATGYIFNDKQGRPFSATMEQRIVVQGGDGDNVETASVSGLTSALWEARLGLTTGKKVTRALIRLERGSDAWQFSLKAEDFTLSSVKPPKMERDTDADDDAVFMEKIFLIDSCLELLDVMYAHFLTIRLGPQWQKEVAAIQQWMQQA